MTKQFKVTYTVYSNFTKTYETDTEIIEAESEEEVEKIVRDWGNDDEAYFPERIEEYYFPERIEDYYEDQ